MPFARIFIEVNADHFQAEITSAASWTAAPRLGIDGGGPSIGGFQMTPRIIGLGKKAFDNSVVTISVYVQTAENVLQFKSSKGANNSVRYSSYGPNVGDPIIDTRVHFDNVDTPVTLALNPTARRELEDAAERAAASFDANTSVEVQIIKAFGCPQ